MILPGNGRVFQEVDNLKNQDQEFANQKETLNKYAREYGECGYLYVTANEYIEVKRLDFSLMTYLPWYEECIVKDIPGETPYRKCLHSNMVFLQMVKEGLAWNVPTTGRILV